MATVGCGISHKDTKHTDKCSNNRTKMTKQVLFQNIVKITQQNKRLT